MNQKQDRAGQCSRVGADQQPKHEEEDDGRQGVNDDIQKMKRHRVNANALRVGRRQLREPRGNRPEGVCDRNVEALDGVQPKMLQVVVTWGRDELVLEYVQVVVPPGEGESRRPAPEESCDCQERGDGIATDRQKGWRRERGAGLSLLLQALQTLAVRSVRAHD